MTKRLNLTTSAVLSALFLAACGECKSAGPEKTVPETREEKTQAAAPAAEKDVSDEDMSFADVRKKAAAEKKPILISFNGSDWCPWCMKLDQEVFSQESFQDWAEEQVVMYVADFPRTKKLDAATTKQNEALAEKYKVDGYPTVILIRADGSEIARTGYREGGPEKYIRHLKELLKKF